MAICDVNSVEAQPAYEAVRQKVINQISTKSIPFIYSEKHEFKFPKGATGPVFVCENGTIDSKVKDTINKGKKGNLAEGFCYRGTDKKLVVRVVKGNLSSSNFKVKGVTDFVIAKGDGPIASDKNVAGNELNINKSKLDQFPDILKRQEKKLEEANQRIKEIEEKKKEVATTIQKLAEDKKKIDPTNTVGLETHKKMVDEANDLKVKLSSEFSEVSKIKRFADDLIKKAKAAKTDQEKADAVFADEKFGSTLKALEGTAYKAMKDTNDAIMVLGRTEDTWKLQMEDAEKPRALVIDPKLYNLVANDAFMKGGLDIKARFQLVSGFTPETINFLKQKGVNKTKLLEYVNRVKEKEPGLWSKPMNAPAVSARELGQLLDDGYWFGIYPVYDKNKMKDGEFVQTGTVQMMFPSAAKPDLLSEITNFNKKKLRPVGK